MANNRCLFCGKVAELNEDKICSECAKSLNQDGFSSEQNFNYSNDTNSETNIRSKVPTQKIVNILDKFYYILKYSTIALCIIFFIYWLYTLLTGVPEWNILIIGVSFLAGGLFTAYLTAAVSKIIELLNSINNK